MVEVLLNAPHRPVTMRMVRWFTGSLWNFLDLYFCH